MSLDNFKDFNEMNNEIRNSQDWDAALKRMLFLAAQGIAIEDPEDVK